jgi:probable phosphoglycerate mutase
MTILIFVRHAQGYHNVDGIKRGRLAYNDPIHLDAELTLFGIQQAKENSLENQQFDAIYCSPMRRCRQTLLYMYPISAKLPVIVDDRLIEQPQGKNMCDKRIEKHEMLMTTPMSWNTDLVSQKNPFILNESIDERNMDSFTEEVKNRYPDGKILIITHGVWIKNWLSTHGYKSRYINNCEIVRMKI